MVRISFDCDARRYTVSLNGQGKSFGFSLLPWMHICTASVLTART